MIYMRNITITTAKSATYLENVGSNTLVPAMRKAGYTSSYAGAITAASSVIGPIIPPSIIMIFYGALMNTSVAALFIGGMIPGSTALSMPSAARSSRRRP